MKGPVSDACLRAHLGLVIDTDYSPPAGSSQIKRMRLVAFDTKCVHLAPPDSLATSPHDQDTQPFLREHIRCVRWVPG
jgi:hypothetical protein